VCRKYILCYSHLNVGQTSYNPVDCLKTPAKPRRVSPNPNAPSDHTLDPIMTVGSGVLEGLSQEGLPGSAKGWFYDLIGWTVGRSLKSRVLLPDWLQLFFRIVLMDRYGRWTWVMCVSVVC
jgi:hypothetical protein